MSPHFHSGDSVSKNMYNVLITSLNIVTTITVNVFMIKLWNSKLRLIKIKCVKR